jgi:hypothetical protein
MAAGRFDCRSELDLEYTFRVMSDRWFVAVVIGLGSASIALLMAVLFWL